MTHGKTRTYEPTYLERELAEAHAVLSEPERGFQEWLDSIRKHTVLGPCEVTAARAAYLAGRTSGMDVAIAQMKGGAA